MTGCGAGFVPALSQVPPPKKKKKNQKNAKTFISDCDRHVLRRVFGVIVTVFTAYLEVDRRTIGTQLALVNEGNAKCLKKQD